jgi:superfamily II DNA or RNA helicase
MYGFVYTREHQSYEDCIKLGITTNIPERESTYLTGELKPGKFTCVFQVECEKLRDIEKTLQKNFKNLNIYYGGGIEFYKSEIKFKIEPYFISENINYKKLTGNEIDDLVRVIRERKTSEFYKHSKNKFSIRPYQSDIIEYSKKELSENYKLYIELPTGGGKSFIVYNILSYFKSKTIIFISPRLKVNEQNIRKEYLEILTEPYEIYNKNVSQNFDKCFTTKNNKIIICCTNSVHAIYKKILEQNISEILVWFDEAHYAIENWTDDLTNETQNFWLTNTTNIKYRIFTSASPNKEKVEKNKQTFGILYSSIKVSELIRLKYLAPISAYSYMENAKNISVIRSLLKDFTSKEKKHGFSFHSDQANAGQLFIDHYSEYKKGNTDVKPFLLISNPESFNKHIDLDYDFKSIDKYENTQNSMGYVVQQYSIGYDFNKIDFICFSDPKHSSKDIIQCIGRGIRIDLTNEKKELVVSLPIYYDEGEDNKYKRIVEVLSYLVCNAEINFEDIKFGIREKTTNEFHNIQSNSADYSGINEVRTKCLELIRSQSYNQNKAIEILKSKNIKSKEDYSKECKKDPRLPENPELYYNHFKGWLEYLSISENYYGIEECKKMVREYVNKDSNLKLYSTELSKLTLELSKLDTKFPSSDLWCEYYKIKHLGEIIPSTLFASKKMVQGLK